MSSPAPEERLHRARLPDDLVAGVLLLALAGLFYGGAYGMEATQLRGIGPGLVPKTASALLGVLGLVLAANAVTARRDAASASWSMRAPLLICGAIVLFALAMRGADVGAFELPASGLIVAVPLTVVCAGLADARARLGKLLWLALGLTALCGVLFKDLLGTAIPFDPAGLVPQFVSDGYAALKGLLGAALKAVFSRPAR